MRNPAAAGSFYPYTKEEIGWAVEECFNLGKRYAKPASACAGVAPHAGYMYSGIAAATVFLSIKELATAETVVFIGPNHTGFGAALSISMEDWSMPTGVCKNDTAFGMEILRNSKNIKGESEAHMKEHSIEVQLPFLQAINAKAQIVPICMGAQGLEAATEVAQAVFLAQEKLGRKTVVIASSDFSHYVSAKDAERMDREALSHILKLDAEGFLSGVMKNEWSICGHGPIAAAMLYAKKRGSKKGLELLYTNSAEATGDDSSVVAYAGILFPGGT